MSARNISVTAAFGAGALEALGLPAEPGAAAALGDGVVFADPRLPGLGARAILPRGTEASVLEAAGFSAADVADYDRLRLEAGVPDGSRDLIVEKAILLENNLDELNAISWQKGCYMGQELTARTRYRGLVRKRLFPVIVEGALPEPGTTGDAGRQGSRGDAVRQRRQGAGPAAAGGDRARAEAEGIPLLAGEAKLTPVKPDWVNF